MIESVTVLFLMCVCVCVCVRACVCVRGPGERAGVTLSLMRSPREGRRVNWEVLGKSQDELR